jgi:hypothetical protein
MTKAREPGARYQLRRRAARGGARSASLRVNARFDPDTARKLRELMVLKNLTVLQALKQAVDTLHGKIARAGRPTAYEIALKVGLIGCAEGPRDLSTNYKRYVHEYLARKYPQHLG